jgi:hypothetical protein
MSKKKDRGWFVCPQWGEMVLRHYADDAEAARALGIDVKVVTRVHQGTPVARSTLLKLLQRFGRMHRLAGPVVDFIVDNRLQ